MKKLFIRGLPLAALLACALSVQAGISNNPKNLPIPNPYLSFLPSGVSEKSIYLRKEELAKQALQNKKALKNRAQFLQFSSNNLTEVEPNDVLSTAQPIENFGTALDKSDSFSLSASFRADVERQVIQVNTAEDNGDIPKATEIQIQESTTYTITSEIGDGPHGFGGLSTGDFDFYKLKGLTTGQVLFIDVNARRNREPASNLDSFIYFLDSNGDIIDLNDDFDGLDSFLELTVPSAGDFYVVVSGFGSGLLADINDSSSGTNAGSEGEYDLIITDQIEIDTDIYRVDLLKGDVLGVAVDNTATAVEVVDAAGNLVMASAANLSFILPEESPFHDLEGNASSILVIPSTGLYYINVSGSAQGEGATYMLRAKVARPALEQGLVPQKQKLFIDFDGADINANLLFQDGSFFAQLSPMRDFLNNWGLTLDDEDELIDAILSVMEKQLKTELQENSGISKVDLEILNSRDHADVFGDENVSRIIIGGTADEIGFFTIGIAESIDPGNYATQETAVVLLDVLSAPSFDFNSLNFFEVEQGSSKINFIARAVGSVASHEAGHFFSSFHTDNSNETANIMDEGGNLPQILGLNNAGKYEDGFEPLIQLTADEYSLFEGFSGVEDTMISTAYGLLSVFVETETETETETEIEVQSNSGSSGGGAIGFWVFAVFFMFCYRRRLQFAKK